MGPAHLSGSACIVGVLIAVGAAANAGAEEPFRYLHVTPITVREGADVDPSRPLRLALYAKALDEVAASFDASARPRLHADRVEVDLRDTPPGDPPTPAHLEATFVVDFDEPAVREVVAFIERAGAEPATIARLVDAVDAWISEKTGARQLSVASQVARARAGRCSEHALLLVALARATGWPARVVRGTAIVTHGSELAAYGHAWAEIHDGERWVRADATRIDTRADVRYLRSEVMRNEGPGFAFALLRPGAMLSRIEVIGNVDTAAAER